MVKAISRNPIPASKIGAMRRCFRQRKNNATNARAAKSTIAPAQIALVQCNRHTKRAQDNNHGKRSITGNERKCRCQGSQPVAGFPLGHVIPSVMSNIFCFHGLFLRTLKFSIAIATLPRLGF